jgi:hypothetical protein
MPEIPLERDHSAARDRLATVYPDEMMNKSAETYRTHTRFEGHDFAKSTLVHSTTGAEVGHLAWSPNSGRIISTNIDTSHRLGGANFGALLHESWKSAAMMNVAGPTHGEDENFGPGNRLASVIAGSALSSRRVDAPIISDVDEGAPRIIRQSHNWDRDSFRTRDSDITNAATRQTNSMRNALLSVLTANEDADTILRQEPSSVPMRDARETTATDWDGIHASTLSAYSQSNDGNATTPTFVPSTIPQSFSDMIGRAPSESEVRVPQRGTDFCSACNNHREAVAVASIPFERPHQDLTSLDINTAVQNHLDDSLEFTVSSMSNQGLAHPLGHRTFTRSLRSVDNTLVSASAPVFVNPESSGDGSVHHLLVRQVLRCPRCSRR